jgi:hypothetical protein
VEAFFLAAALHPQIFLTQKQLAKMFIYMIGYRHLQNLIFIFRRQRKALYLKKSRKKSEASQLMSKFYQSNKDLYPDSIKNYREEIITFLMEGFSP